MSGSSKYRDYAVFTDSPFVLMKLAYTESRLGKPDDAVKYAEKAVAFDRESVDLQLELASRYLDASRELCAIQLAGCSPTDLIEHEQDELRRDAAEGARLAYVAATRARDLLVIPAVGDGEREGWIQSLNSAIYPPMETRREAQKGLRAATRRRESPAAGRAPRGSVL